MLMPAVSYFAELGNKNRGGGGGGERSVTDTVTMKSGNKNSLRIHVPVNKISSQTRPNETTSCLHGTMVKSGNKNSLQIPAHKISSHTWPNKTTTLCLHDNSHNLQVRVQ